MGWGFWCGGSNFRVFRGFGKVGLGLNGIIGRYFRCYVSYWILWCTRCVA